MIITACDEQQYIITNIDQQCSSDRVRSNNSSSMMISVLNSGASVAAFINAAMLVAAFINAAMLAAAATAHLIPAISKGSNLQQVEGLHEASV